MPGLKQLQQFNSDIMTLGDEAKIRAARGEKPVFVSIPKNVQDIDDSDEFLDGLPMLSEEEQAQADAAAKEREREANDFSDFMDGEEEENSEEKQKTAPKQESVPDMSDLLPSDGGMDFGDFDLSEFEDKTPEPEPEPEPEEVAIEDMDLDSLLALSEQPKKEKPGEENDLFGSDQQNTESEIPTVDVSDDIFDNDILGFFLPQPKNIKAFKKLSEIVDEAKIEPSFLRRLFVLYQPNAAKAESIANTLRLTKKQKETFANWAKIEVTQNNIMTKEMRLKFMYRYGKQFCIDKILLTCALYDFHPQQLNVVLQEVENAIVPIFPIRGRDVINFGITPNGQNIGKILEQLERQWIDCDFSLTREELLNEIKILQ